MQILALLAEHAEGMTLAKMSEALALPKTSVFSLLRSLESGGYVASSAGRHEIGPEALRLSAAIQRNQRFPNCARPALERLAQATDETVVIGVLSDDRKEVVYVDVIETTNALRYSVQIGARRALYASAVGQTVLAYMDPAEQQRYIDTVTFSKYTRQTISSKRALIMTLQQVRREGICMSVGGMVEGVTGIAAPIFDCNGAIFGGIAASAPSERMLANRPMIEAALRTAGEEVSRILGFSKHLSAEAPAAHPKRSAVTYR